MITSEDPGITLSTLQDRASPAIEQLIFFRDHALIIILIISTTVSCTIIIIAKNATKPNPFEIIPLQTARKESNWRARRSVGTSSCNSRDRTDQRVLSLMFMMMIIIIQNKQTGLFILEGQIIKTMWTVAPAVILVFIAIPSLWLLYLIDEIHNLVITLKADGHQWYWSYEYSDFTKLEFDPYIVEQEDQKTNAVILCGTSEIAYCLKRPPQVSKIWISLSILHATQHTS